MANKFITSVAGVDRTSARLVPKFARGSSWDSSPLWRCAAAFADAGPKPSLAFVVIPTSQSVWDEGGNAVAFNPDGPAKDIRIGTRCHIDRIMGTSAETIYCGSVVMIEHDKDKNAIVCTLYDDRWLLQEIRIIGRWVSVSPNDPVAGGQGPWFQQGWPAWFNKGGRANGIWYAGHPYFAPYEDYGLVGDAEPPAASAHNENSACYWTLGMILEYLRYFYGPAAQAVTQFPFLSKAPSWLVWSEDFGACVDQDSVANFDQGPGQGHSSQGGGRKGREVLLEGLGLMDALHILLATSGGWTPTLTPSPVGDQQYLDLAPTRYLSDQNAKSIRLAGTGKAKDILDKACITGGSFTEDGSNFVSAVAGAGQLILIERRCSTLAGDGAQIKYAHSNARWEQFKTLAAGNNVVLDGQTVAGMGAAGPQSFAQACALFREVLATWCLNPTFNYQADTPYSAYPRAMIPRPPWPTALSLYSDAGARDFAGMRFPIYVEIRVGTTWTYAGQFDSLEVLDNGIIHLPILRDLNVAVKCWAPVAGAWDVVGVKLNIVKREVRLTLAIPMDHRMTLFGVGPQGGENAQFIYKENPDVDRIEPTLSRRGYLDVPLYALHLRKNSWPLPASQNYPQGTDKPGSIGDHGVMTDAIRSDGAMLLAHVKRSLWENARIWKGGEPRMDGWLCTTFQPGDQIKDFAPIGASGSTQNPPFPVRAVLAGVKWTCEPDKISTGYRLT